MTANERTENVKSYVSVADDSEYLTVEEARELDQMLGY